MEMPFALLLKLVATQLKLKVKDWEEYGQLEVTRREHLAELQSVFGFQIFSMTQYKSSLKSLEDQ